MKSLETVQKTFKVFEVITKVAEILCIVGASLCAVTALCAVIWLGGGHVFSIFGTPIEPFFEGDLLTTYVKLLALTFTITADAILFGFAHNYLKHEQEEGTPFTEKGAKRLKKLGIRCIYIPVIALSVSAAIAQWQGVKYFDITGNLPSTVFGIGLILVSLVFRYGAELENGNQAEAANKKMTNMEEM